jgi:CheY-like chemotaxis protein
VADSPAVILIVEDNTVTREGLVTILRRQGYDALTAKDGGAALELLFRGSKPDLILLDMLMPGVDGWHFLARFRANRSDSVPVVIMTGSILTAEWAEAQDCAGFIRKPIDEDELLVAVRHALARPIA